MGKATGIFLILAGVGTAALVLPAVDKDAERQLSDVVRIATGATPQGSSSASTSAPTVVPSIVPQTVARASVVTAAATQPKAAPAPVPAETIEQPVRSAVAPSAGADPMLLATPKLVARNSGALAARPVDSQTRATLARDIQRELKRVGCYDGEVSGEWSSSTRSAMKAFIDRVNAALPTDEPDHILRTMVQGHPGNACKSGCPSGQTMNSAGRCAATAIIAHNQVPKAQPRPALARDAAGQAPSQPPRQEIAVVRPTVPKSSWETTTAVAALPPPSGGSIAAGTMPEGRMAIGAPLARETDKATGAAPGQAERGVAARPLQAKPSADAASAGYSAGVQAPGAIAALSLSPGPLGQAAAADSTIAVAPPKEHRAAPERSRQQVAAVKRQQPVFKFPTPSFLGASTYGAPKYQRPDRSTFGVHIYERLIQNGR